MTEYRISKVSDKVGKKADVTRISDSGTIDLSRYAGDFLATFSDGEVRIVPYYVFQKRYTLFRDLGQDDPFVCRLPVNRNRQPRVNDITPGQRATGLLMLDAPLVRLKSSGEYVVGGAGVDGRTFNALLRKRIIKEKVEGTWVLVEEWRRAFEEHRNKKGSDDKGGEASTSLTSNDDLVDDQIFREAVGSDRKEIKTDFEFVYMGEMEPTPRS